MSKTWDAGIPDVAASVPMAPLAVYQIPKTSLALRRVTGETGTYEVPITPIDQPFRLVLQRKPNSDIYSGTGFTKESQLPNKTGSDLSVSLWATGKSDAEESNSCCDNPWFNNYGATLTFHKVPNSYLADDNVMNGVFTTLLGMLVGTLSEYAYPVSESDPDSQIIDVMKLARGILDPASFQA